MKAGLFNYIWEMKNMLYFIITTWSEKYGYLMEPTRAESEQEIHEFNLRYGRHIIRLSEITMSEWYSLTEICKNV